MASLLAMYETPVTQDTLLYMESISNKVPGDDKDAMILVVKDINFDDIGSVINYLHTSSTWFGTICARSRQAR